MDTSSRSVRAVASDVVVTLMAHKIVANDRTTITKICAALGLDRTHLEDAAERSRLGVGWGMIPQTAAVQYAGVRVESPTSPPSATPPPVEPEPPAPNPEPPAPNPQLRPSNKPPTTPPRPERTRNGARELRCTGPCGRWLTEDKFLARTDRPGRFTSRCLECRKVYQRERRVSTATFDALNKVGLKFQLDEHSNLVGLLCTKCDQPFVPGDTAEGTTGLSHTVCPTVKPKKRKR